MPPTGARVFVSAIEPSADAHCAALIRRLKAECWHVEVLGLGGPKMAAAGCNLVLDATDRAQVGLGALGQIAYFRQVLKQIRARFHQWRPEVVVVCDSPSFNFHVARLAKEAGSRTVFYVAPQLWAWGKWRLSKLRRWCDRLCCILPFERQWFQQRGIPAIYVGHPMIEQLGDLNGNVKQYRDLDKRGPQVALMPGSRASEIHPLWPAMQQIALRIRQVYPGSRFTAVAVNPHWQQRLRATQVPGLQCDYAIDAVYSAARQADLALVASGSATLEVAAAGCPMVVMYKTNRLAWHLVGRWLVRPKYFCLVNLIADRPLVPEYVPYFTSTGPISRQVLSLLADPNALTSLSKDLVATVSPLGDTAASRAVTQVIVEQLRTSGPAGLASAL